MNPDPNRAKAIFLEAVEQHAPDRWPAFLEQACGGDADLRARVEQLLSAHQAVKSVKRDAAEPAAAPAATMDEPITERPGRIIGPYKLLQVIGEGGFGVVYMAEQEKPVRRMVALKIIKPGMDSAQVIARFESERQALAFMDHPNIAKVLDAGTMESPPPQPSPIKGEGDKSRQPGARDALPPGGGGLGWGGGRPYFVMELVKGVPITEFCDKNHMPAAERLKLFIDVCHAIQHAHHKGIIHRDIKPSNVMVTLHDGVPVVKVIDFGVAKAITQKLTERTLFTAYGQMIGTPVYMSPEQAEMSGLDIDTRSDIYSLGVLLYELLTGTTPLETKRLREAGYAEMQRMIREEEPPRPSTRLSSMRDSATILASKRGTDPRHLAQLLRGDLDWIAIKALEKDRNRRYASPGLFAEDIERYLRHEAILARPPSTAYKLRKFAQRNRAAVVTATLVAVALLIGTAVATWQAVMATRARQQALQALEEKEKARAAEAEERGRAQANEQKAVASAAAEKTAKDAALAREGETKAVLDFVQNRVFAAARPQGLEGGLGRDVTLRTAIDAALPFVDKTLSDQPLIEAQLRMTLGNSFWFLGEAKSAAEQYEAARTIYTKHRGAYHPDTLRSMNGLATSYDALGRHADALKLFEETLALQKAKLGTDHRDTLWTMHGIANSYTRLGRHGDALKLYEETLTLRKAKLGTDHPDTLWSMHGIANSYTRLGRYGDALKLYEETLALRKAKLGTDHPDTLWSMQAIANSYSALGRHADALKLYEETLALRKAKLGTDHPDTLFTMNNLAVCYTRLSRHADALKLHEETLALRKAKLGTDHPDTGATMYNIGCVHALLMPKSRDGAKEADLAMDWVKQGVAAGFKDVEQFKTDTDLDALRDREDFKKLLADLEAANKEKK
jgi:serine/threonine protein kinase/tetratricopeptide (TPR) repeat protein